MYPAPKSRKRHNSAGRWWTQHIRCGTDKTSVVVWKCAVSFLVSGSPTHPSPPKKILIGSRRLLWLGRVARLRGYVPLSHWDNSVTVWGWTYSVWRRNETKRTHGSTSHYWECENSVRMALNKVQYCHLICFRGILEIYYVVLLTVELAVTLVGVSCWWHRIVGSILEGITILLSC